jgi:hypothetical protein
MDLMINTKGKNWVQQIKLLRQLTALARRVHLRNDILRSQLGESNIVEDTDKYTKQYGDRPILMENIRLPNIANYCKPKVTTDTTKLELI